VQELDLRQACRAHLDRESSQAWVLLHLPRLRPLELLQSVLVVAGVLVRLRQSRPWERLGPLAQPRLARLARALRTAHLAPVPPPSEALALPNSKKTYTLQKDKN